MLIQYIMKRVKIIDKLGCWIEEKKKINPQIIMSRRYSTVSHIYIMMGGR
jgi:hypothetical protein